MSDRVLAKQFDGDAGMAFMEVIRKADRPIRLQEIRAALVEAGVRVEDINRQWGNLRDHIKSHPSIGKPKPTEYEWSPLSQPSLVSLQNLASQVGKRGPVWLVQAYVDNIADSLARAESTGPRAQIGWTEQREQEGDATGGHRQ